MKNRKKHRVIAAFGREAEVDIAALNREFWAHCSDEEIMDAGWDLVVQAWKTKGKDPRELRLQRSTIFFKPS